MDEPPFHADKIAALVLGAAVWPGGQPSPTLMRRTRHAAALYRRGLVQVVVPCGGLGRHPPAEATVMTAILQAEGVPEDAIRPEATSRSTAENIAHALPLLGDVTRVVIVTDAPHAPRALLVARRHGLRARADWPPWRGARAWPQLRMALREVPAILAYLLRLRG